jgi:hypothetical protein
MRPILTGLRSRPSNPPVHSLVPPAQLAAGRKFDKSRAKPRRGRRNYLRAAVLLPRQPLVWGPPPRSPSGRESVLWVPRGRHINRVGRKFVQDQAQQHNLLRPRGYGRPLFFIRMISLEAKTWSEQTSTAGLATTSGPIEHLSRTAGRGVACTVMSFGGDFDCRPESGRRVYDYHERHPEEIVIIGNNGSIANSPPINVQKQSLRWPVGTSCLDKPLFELAAAGACHGWTPASGTLMSS